MFSISAWTFDDGQLKSAIRALLEKKRERARALGKINHRGEFVIGALIERLFRERPREPTRWRPFSRYDQISRHFPANEPMR
jgi:hypothetical protein